MARKWIKRISYIYLLLSVLIAIFAGTFRTLFIIERDVLPHPHPIFHIEFDGVWDLSFAEARDLALYFDGLYDQMGENPYPPPSRELLVNLALEALPFFEYEGALSGLAQWAAPIDLYIYQVAQQHLHTAGQSNCAGFVLNYRYANPFSAWFNKDAWVDIAIHEMVHVQQGINLCEFIDSLYLEQTAEIVSLEVMAGMVNYGNRDMTYALVEKLRGMSANAAYGIAAKAGHLEWYKALREEILEDPYKDAAFEKSRRFWANNPERLDFILQAYSVRPLERIAQAILYDNNEIEGLILPNGHIANMGTADAVFVPGPPFMLDDLAYFLEHSEDIVARYIQELDSQGG